MLINQWVVIILSDNYLYSIIVCVFVVFLIVTIGNGNIFQFHLNQYFRSRFLIEIKIMNIRDNLFFPLL